MDSKLLLSYYYFQRPIFRAPETAYKYRLTDCFIVKSISNILLSILSLEFLFPFGHGNTQNFARNGKFKVANEITNIL